MKTKNINIIIINVFFKGRQKRYGGVFWPLPLKQKYLPLTTVHISDLSLSLLPSFVITMAEPMEVITVKNDEPQEEDISDQFLCCVCL